MARGVLVIGYAGNIHNGQCLEVFFEGLRLARQLVGEVGFDVRFRYTGSMCERVMGLAGRHEVGDLVEVQPLLANGAAVG